MQGVSGIPNTLGKEIHNPLGNWRHCRSKAEGAKDEKSISLRRDPVTYARPCKVSAVHVRLGEAASVEALLKEVKVARSLSTKLENYTFLRHE